MRKFSAFEIITLSLFFILLIPESLKEGMFLDGIVYANVAKNFAFDFQSFWKLSFSPTSFEGYDEQLPLFFWLEAIFFKVLGASIYTERIFGILCAFASAIFIKKIWFLTQDSTNRKMYWLPILLWISCGVVFWTFSNNMQEMLMSVFSLMGTFFVIKGLKLNSKILLNLLLAGILIFCCSFCKGVQGLFGLTIIFFYYLFVTEFKWNQMIKRSIILFTPIAVIYALLLIYEPSHKFILGNLENRIGKTFNNEQDTTLNRWYLLKTLFFELLPCILLLLVTAFTGHSQKREKSWAYFFFAIAFSASLPLLVTLEQRNFYVAVSIPFFTLAFSYLMHSQISHWIKSIKSRKVCCGLRYFSLICLVGGIIYSTLSINLYKRDRKLITNILFIGNHLNSPKTIQFKNSEPSFFKTRAYLARYCDIDVDQEPQEYSLSYETAVGAPQRIVKLPEDGLILSHLDRQSEK